MVPGKPSLRTPGSVCAIARLDLTSLLPKAFGTKSRWVGDGTDENGNNAGAGMYNYLLCVGKKMLTVSRKTTFNCLADNKHPQDNNHNLNCCQNLLPAMIY